LSKQENLNELLAGTKEFVSNRMEEGDENISLADFMGEVSLSADQDLKDAEDGNLERVTLMTAHAAKGLEFNNVFIVGVEEDLFPSAMSKNSITEIEEERRLLYVAITRARNFCLMSYAKSRYRNGSTATCSPSRFLRDIDRKYLSLTAGSSLGSSTRSFDDYADSYHSAPKFIRETAKTSPASNPARNTEPLSPGRPQDVPAISRIHSFDELRVNMRIAHDRFREGIITAIDSSRPDAARITVRFSQTSERILLLKFARFAILD
ncbi:MAG: ATP-dependent helicase, partial [Paramuribaculum sp.]|nr:ATP-dependent helicase [Paramuribaculum sp.]